MRRSSASPSRVAPRRSRWASISFSSTRTWARASAAKSLPACVTPGRWSSRMGRAIGRARRRRPRRPPRERHRRWRRRGDGAAAPPGGRRPRVEQAVAQHFEMAEHLTSPARRGEGEDTRCRRRARTVDMDDQGQGLDIRVLYTIWEANQLEGKTFSRAVALLAPTAAQLCTKRK